MIEKYCITERFKKIKTAYLKLDWKKEIVIKVGQHHDKAVVLKIRAEQMYKDGFEFFEWENKVWLTDHVPVK